jgi:hypothetical protein
VQTRDVPEPWASRMVQRGLTRRDGQPNISALARSAGVAVETARRVVHGVGIADAGTVAALATVLGDDIAGWLDWRAEGLDVWEPPSESRLLNREEREVLDRLVRLMVMDRRGELAPRIRPLPEPGDRDQAEAYLAGDDSTLIELQLKKAERERRASEAEAARDRGRPGSVQKIRDAQDQAGEPPADDTDDMEPR